VETLKYFDGNATTPLCQEAKAAWIEASDLWWYNCSSPFSQGSAVRVRLEAEREKLAGLLGCDKDEIVFNSGATEGNNTVFGVLSHLCPGNQKILISSIEHSSVLEPARHYLGDRLLEIPVDPHGQVLLSEIENQVRLYDVFGISVMAANNETGVLQPWEEVQRLCESKGILYHCDAAQWIGKNSIQGMGNCDFVTGCAHKFGGPKGCGFLKLSKASCSHGFLKGGKQEGGFRAGTEDYPSIAAMMAALESHGSINAENGRDFFENTLSQRIPEVRILGESAPRLSQTSMMIMPRFKNDRWVSRLAKKGFLVSTGSACSTNGDTDSQVLRSMGIDSKELGYALRVSGGRWTSDADWEKLANAFILVWQELLDSPTNPNIVSLD
jgi:cysteine desulfurase